MTNIDVTFLLIFKFANHGTKEGIISTANKVLVGILITMSDVTRNIAINRRHCLTSSLLDVKQPTYVHYSRRIGDKVVVAVLETFQLSWFDMLPPALPIFIRFSQLIMELWKQRKQ